MLLFCVICAAHGPAGGSQAAEAEQPGELQQKLRLGIKADTDSIRSNVSKQVKRHFHFQVQKIVILIGIALVELIDE